MLALVGASLYTSYLNKQILSLKGDIELAKESLEPATLETFKTLDNRLRMATDLLDRHITVAPLFETLERLTVQGVRYTTFGFRNSDGQIEIQMNGEARELALVALQARAFGEESRIVNPIFSNLTLEPTGKTSFDVSFTLDPSLISYVTNTSF